MSVGGDAHTTSENDLFSYGSVSEAPTRLPVRFGELTMQDLNNVTRDRFATLFRILAPPLAEPPSDIGQAIRDLPEPYLLPNSWASWLLFSLACYHRLQESIERAVQHFAPGCIPPSLEMLEQEQPVMLTLNEPGIWPDAVELECHCGFGRTTERGSDEIITFGLSPQTRGVFFADVFRSVTTTHGEPSWKRLRELHPSNLAIDNGLSDLETAGLVERVSLFDTFVDPDVEPDAYRLSAPALWQRPMIERFCRRWQDRQQRLWLAATVGDWLKADELAERTGAVNILKVTGPRADWQRRERKERALCRRASGAAAEVTTCVLQDLA
jgi:hypothetical protein